MFTPILTCNSNWEFEESKEKGSVLLITAENNSDVDILQILDRILTFLSIVLKDFTSCTDPKTSFLTQIGSYSYEKIASLLIKEWLIPLTPKNYKELTDYPVQIAEKFMNFEIKWSKESIFIPVDGKYLTEYFKDIVSISLKQWRSDLLKEAREIINSSDYEYEIVCPKMVSEATCILILVSKLKAEKYPESEFDYILQSPKCAISRRIIRFVDLIRKTIVNANSMDKVWYIIFHLMLAKNMT